MVIDDGCNFDTTLLIKQFAMKTFQTKSIQ